MHRFKALAKAALACGLVAVMQPGSGFAKEKEKAPTGSAPALRDGQHDFDWEIGTWRIHMSRLQHPLTGSKTWVQLDGTVVARKVWDGRANLAEVKADGPSSHLEFLSLRLYDPQAHQWNLHFASSNAGTLSVPMVGEFKDGKGEFIDQETYNGRTLLVRIVFSKVSPDVGHSEQAFSDDGGKTWEVNWVNDYTRIGPAPKT